MKLKPEDVLSQYKGKFFQSLECEGGKAIIKFNSNRALVVTGENIEIFKDMELSPREHRLKQIKFSRSNRKDRKDGMAIRLEFGKEFLIAIDIIGCNLQLAGSIDE